MFAGPYHRVEQDESVAILEDELDQFIKKEKRAEHELTEAKSRVHVFAFAAIGSYQAAVMTALRALLCEEDCPLIALTPVIGVISGFFVYKTRELLQEWKELRQEKEQVKNELHFKLREILSGDLAARIKAEERGLKYQDLS
jgi:hypothetical protein